MGTCIGAVVGLVAITPAAGFVSVPHSLAIGIISSIVSNLVVEWRTRTTIDDTLDVFPCHGVGGMVGMLLTGVFANQNVKSKQHNRQRAVLRTYAPFLCTVHCARCSIGIFFFRFVIAIKNNRYDLALARIKRRGTDRAGHQPAWREIIIFFRILIWPRVISIRVFL